MNPKNKKINYIAMACVAIASVICFLLVSFSDVFNNSLSAFILDHFIIYATALFISFFSGFLGFTTFDDFDLEESEIIFYKQPLFIILLIQLICSIYFNDIIKVFARSGFERGYATIVALMPIIIYIFTRPLKRLIKIENILKEIQHNASKKDLSEK